MLWFINSSQTSFKNKPEGYCWIQVNVCANILFWKNICKIVFLVNIIDEIGIWEKPKQHYFFCKHQLTSLNCKVCRN